MTEDTTLVFTGAIGGVDGLAVAAADHWKASVGKYKLQVDFDETLLEDGVDTTPREVQVHIDVGNAMYPGDIFLDENDLEVKSNKWEAK